jgi:hypothetical protein
MKILSAIGKCVASGNAEETTAPLSYFEEAFQLEEVFSAC